MFWILFLSKAFCEIFLFDENIRKREIVFDVTGDQICKGHFEAVPGSTGDFKISIVAKDGGKFFEAENLKNDRKNFAFNITDNKDLICVVEPIWNDNDTKKSSELEVKFETQFDTFRKDVAKQVRVEPATYSLTKIGNVMLDFNNQIEQLIVKLGIVEVEHKKMFVVAVFLSIAVLVIYIAVEIYLLHQLRTFFKTKKLI